MALNWQFPQNSTDAPIGPRNSGIENYTGNRSNSLVREIIQNSLDARLPTASGPARVTFRVEELDTADFSGAQLKTAIQACVDALKSKDEPYRKVFRNAARQLEAARIPSLIITDSNTKGVVDNGEDDSPWAALTRGSGESVKDGNDASGSKGIGKAAAFAATDLRTVLYTTTFRRNGHLESRFIGRAILSGHKDESGEKVTSEGFLGAPDFKSLANGSVPAAYQLDEPGLCLRIPGYPAQPEWQNEVIKTSIANFFHAIVQGNLEVAAESQVVTAANIDDYLHLLDYREQCFVQTSRNAPGNPCEIEGIGKVNLRIERHDSPERQVRDIALVRDAGMMITNSRSKMGPARITIPRHWHHFTAIVECLSDPELSSAVRDSESPKHDELDIDRIPNAEDRPAARKALRELGRWMEKVIKEKAEPTSSLEPVNAAEAASMLPIRQHNDNPLAAAVPNGDGISQPVQRGTSVAQQSAVVRRGPRKGKPHQPPKPQPPVPGQPLAQGDALSRAKFRIGGVADSTHTLTVQIPPFQKRLDNVQVVAVTEHGVDVQLKITGARIGGKELKPSNHKISAIHPNGNNPVTLEIKMQEPVSGRRFLLRTAKERKAS